MKTPSAASIVAVMSGVAFANVRAQSFIPRGPELSFITSGRSVAPCPQHTVFTNAVRGTPICNELTSGRASPTSDNTGMFLNDRERAERLRKLNVAIGRRTDPDDARDFPAEKPKDRRVDDALTSGRESPTSDDPGMFLDSRERAEEELRKLSVANSAPMDLDARNLPAEPPKDRSVIFDPPRSLPELAIEVTTAPEPASLALVATGFVGLAAYRRRRAKGKEGINN